MKKLLMLFIVSFLLSVSTACNYSQEPKITFKAVVSQLSEEDFEDVGIHGIENLTKEDFRKFTFNFEIKHHSNYTRKIEFPKRGIWREAINSIDDNDRYYFGSGYNQNNDSENFAEYNSEFVFYSKGLNEEEIRNVFKLIVFEIYLATDEGEIIEKEYKVNNLIELMTTRVIIIREF